MHSNLIFNCRIRLSLKAAHNCEMEVYFNLARRAGTYYWKQLKFILIHELYAF